ncbi:MAG: hypothetical protein ORO03_10825, partial [Alphaproteobacteria bacterium]|nr:hypothetical protein [Alphaproteobacteria bacterium]
MLETITKTQQNGFQGRALGGGSFHAPFRGLRLLIYCLFFREVGDGIQFRLIGFCDNREGIGKNASQKPRK